MKYKQHRFDELISQYDSKILIQEFAKINQNIFNNKAKNKEPYIEIIMERGFRKITNIVGHWTIRDIIIRIISRAHNDNYALIKKNINDEELKEIIAQFGVYEQENSKKIKEADIFYILHGYSEQQFYCQVNRSLDNFTRNRIIFVEINRLSGNILDIETPLMNTLGLNYHEFQYLMAVLYIKSKDDINPLNYKEGYFNGADFIDAESKYKKLVKYFTGEYKDVQEVDSNLARYLFPIIFDGTSTTVIDMFMLEQKLYEGDYWVIREYYCKNPLKRDANYFPNTFGILFENYIKEILKDIKNCCYTQLTNENSKEILKASTDNNEIYADFIIETTKYCVILEVKSAILAPKGRDIIDNREAVMKFYERTFVRGSEQVLNTIKRFEPNDRNCYGMVLYYKDGFLKNSTKDIYLRDVNREELRSVLAIDITEFEYLLSAIDKDTELGENIIKSFVDVNEKQDRSKGSDLLNHINIFDTSLRSAIRKFDTIGL
ncbi:MAG: hypothetical protein JJE17_00575 [Peptostreptococcaceae bacterium]|nr:hypothetical protein [Peptostreptococcaceae bacterium]